MAKTLKFQVGPHGTLAALIVAGFLTACGGGGSGGGTASVPTAPAAPVFQASTIVTSVPASTYTGEFSVAYALLNSERANCGFGLLAQSKELDIAASAHASYVNLNSTGGNHFEVVGSTGFTGISPSDRAFAAGYPNVASGVAEVAVLGNGEFAVRKLLSAPYHANALLDGYRDIGIGMQATDDPSHPSFVANPGYKGIAGMQTLSSTEVSTYPCQGTTGVNRQLFGEDPSPVPGRDLARYPIGAPIIVHVRIGNILSITSVSLVNVRTGAPVLLRGVVNAENDPHRLMRSNQAFIAPDLPLEAYTDYQATVSGTNSGQVFSRTFTFRTGDN